MTDQPIFHLHSGDELTFVVKGLDRIEYDIREIRSDLKDLKDKVALKSDMYRILGLMVLAASGAAAVAAFILGGTPPTAPA